LFDARTGHLDEHLSAAGQCFIRWLLKVLLQEVQGILFVSIQQDAAQVQQLLIG